jgi:hypothetical protein
MWTAVISVASLGLVVVCIGVLFAWPYWNEED